MVGPDRTARGAQALRLPAEAQHPLEDRQVEERTSVSAAQLEGTGAGERRPPPCVRPWREPHRCCSGGRRRSRESRRHPGRTPPGTPARPRPYCLAPQRNPGSCGRASSRRARDLVRPEPEACLPDRIPTPKVSRASASSRTQATAPAATGRMRQRSTTRSAPTATTNDAGGRREEQEEPDDAERGRAARTSGAVGPCSTGKEEPPGQGQHPGQDGSRQEHRRVPGARGGGDVPFHELTHGKEQEPDVGDNHAELAQEVGDRGKARHAEAGVGCPLDALDRPRRQEEIDCHPGDEGTASLLGGEAISARWTPRGIVRASRR